MSTISAIEGFVSNLSVHQTDVEFVESDRSIEEVDLIVDSLKSGLKDMVKTFAKYGVELGLGEGEISAARKVAGMGDGE